MGVCDAVCKRMWGCAEMNWPERCKSVSGCLSDDLPGVGSGCRGWVSGFVGDGGGLYREGVWREVGRLLPVRLRVGGMYCPRDVSWFEGGEVV